MPNPFDKPRALLMVEVTGAQGMLLGYQYVDVHCWYGKIHCMPLCLQILNFLLTQINYQQVTPTP